MVFYATFIFSLNVVFGMLLHGKTTTHDFRYSFVSLIVIAPIYGRAMGLW